MGVHGLWELLAPVGRRVSVENLSGKRLAIDASIWMVQFMKAMRDESGEMVRNAHLIGFFRRICKLLFLRTKPVFVFDGATPALKRRTVLARRRQRENAQAKIRKTAERLLLNHLKEVNLKRLAEDIKSQGQDDGGKGKNVTVDYVDNNRNKFTPTSYDQEKLDEMLAASLAAEDNGTLIGDESASGAGISLEDENNGDEEQEELVLPTIQGDVDPNVLSSLPPSMQLDLLAQMRERLMAENRQKYQKVKKVPEKFSALQIQSYLKTVAFRREIDEVQKSAGTRGVGGIQMSKIASETSREFIFSSSFDGNREVLASSRAESSLNDKSEAPIELCSSATLVSRKPSQPNNGPGGEMNEFGAVSNENVETYLDERGHVRVSRLRALGIRMTRDLQRNLDMMKEMEQEKSNLEATKELDSPSIIRNISSGSGVPNSSQRVALSDNATVMDHSHGSLEPSVSAGRTLIQISFDSGFDENIHDGDDEIFNSLAVGKPLVITESENMSFNQPSDATDFGIDWEDQAIKRNTYSKFVNEAQLKCEPSSLKGAISDESGVEWEDGASVETQEAAFLMVEHPKAVSKGILEEESQLQEAIKRSLLDAQATTLGNVSPKTMHIFSTNKVSEFIPDRNEASDSSSLKEKVQNEISFSFESADDELLDIDDGRSVEPTDINTGKLSTILEEKVHINCDSQPTLTYDPVEDICGVEVNADHENSGVETPIFTETEQAHFCVNLADSSLGSAKSAPFFSDSVDHPSAPSGTPFIQDNSANTDSDLSLLERTELDVCDRVNVNKVGVHELNVALKENLEASLVDELAVLNEERLDLGNEQKKLERNAESVSGEMFVEVQELLQMFGLPYIIAPMEAEAQCAFLEQAGLVDGVVTDDSDVFLFGAQSVYKNIFDNRKYVETYFMKDVERELGLSREKLIRMAMLLGSDYTEGISGIGIVNATEVLNAFPEDDGLQKFREWIESPDPTIFYNKKDPTVNKNGSTGKKGRTPTKKGSKKNGEDVSCSASPLDQDDSSFLDKSTVDDAQELKQIFMDKHRNVSKNWHIPSSFPSDAVIFAYMSPKVDTSTEPFSHGRPDHPVLRKLCLEKFGWSYQKTDELLLPVLKEYSKHETQLRLEAFYSFNERFAKIRSKRIKSAVKGITGKCSLDIDLQKDSKSTEGRDLSGLGKPDKVECRIKGDSVSSEVMPLVSKSLKKVSGKKKTGKESTSAEKLDIESPVSAKDKPSVSGAPGEFVTGKLSKKRGKLSDYADIGAGAANSEKNPSVDIHERPQKLRRSTRIRGAVNYSCDVEVDDLDISDMGLPTKYMENPCAKGVLENPASDPITQDLSQLGTDKNGSPSAANISGDYLRMGGGFCIDEED